MFTENLKGFFTEHSEITHKKREYTLFERERQRRRTSLMGNLSGTPTKRQVLKHPVFKRLKRQVYKTSGLQNVRFTKCQVYVTSGLQNVRLQKNIHISSVLVVGGGFFSHISQ